MMEIKLGHPPEWSNLWVATITAPDGRTFTCGLARTDPLSALGALLNENQEALGFKVVGEQPPTG